MSAAIFMRSVDISESYAVVCSLHILSACPVANTTEGSTTRLIAIAEDRVYGFYWDPGMRIRNDIRKSLAAKLDDAQLAMAAEYVGRQFDEEIDKARRDEVRRGGGSDSSSGGN